MVLKQTQVICYDLIFILQVGKKLQEVFKAFALYLITLFTTSCHCLSDSGEHARTIYDLIKRSEYSLNQFLSCVHWIDVHNTAHAPKGKKSRSVRSGDLGGHATGPPLPIHFSL